MSIQLRRHGAASYTTMKAVRIGVRKGDLEIDERAFPPPRQPERNVAMEFDVPKIPIGHREWRAQLKPCDDLGDAFVPPDFDLGDTRWDQELSRQHTKFVEARCRNDCPFLALCSRDALVAAQDFARFQGVAARLHGTWAGVTFNGREGAPQYRNKLIRIADQMNSGEITWEPSSSFPTTHSNSNA